MVSNSDVEWEFTMFAEVWKLFKRLLPVGVWEDEAYWEGMYEEIKLFTEKYPDKFSHSILMAIVEELERRSKNEN